MAVETSFYGSQVGSGVTKVLTYTGTPLELLRHDVVTAFKFFLYLPYIIFPLRPMASGQFSELYPSQGNLRAITLHIVLICLQLPFLLSIPFWILLPVWQVAIGCVVFAYVNKAICKLLNGDSIEFPSNPKYAEAKDHHKHEQWVFLNGVAVGGHWIQSNVDRLALTFGRPILGIHNRTTGILFDVIQCLIQRNFSYATMDVRACYVVVKELLYKPELTKIVFILHSQGGIEGGMILDWLLQEVPQDLLAKLEIYTFGNAANHFNNPHLHYLSQSAAAKHPDRPVTTKTITQVHYHEPSSDDSSVNHPRSTKQQSTSGKTLRHIEHYAHTKDFVAQWGVLYFVPSSSSSGTIALPTTPRFMGRVFERQGKGHQMNMHYLDSMFPLKPSDDPNGGIGGSGFDGVDEEGEFMNSILDLTPGNPTLPFIDLEDEQREGAEMSYQTTQGESLSERKEPEVLLRDFSPTSTFHSLQKHLEKANSSSKKDEKQLKEEFEKVLDGMQFRVKDMSRLWLYVNGRSPKLDEVDVSLARMATI